LLNINLFAYLSYCSDSTTIDNEIEYQNKRTYD